MDIDLSVDQVTVSNSAQGNALAGGVTAASAGLVSRQSMTGATVARSNVVVNGEADGQLSVDTTARGNYLGVTTDRATFAVDSSQSVTGDRVEAGTYVQAPNGRVLQGGFATSTAVANTVALGGPSSSLTGVIDQRAQTTVFAETVADAPFAGLARRLWRDEIIPTLTPPPGEDLDAYARALLARFENPAIRHRTWQIAMDGSQKLPQRLLGTIRERLKAGAPIDHLALGVAAWMRYVTGTDEKGALDAMTRAVQPGGVPSRTVRPLSTGPKRAPARLASAAPPSSKARISAGLLL